MVTVLDPRDAVRLGVKLRCDCPFVEARHGARKYIGTQPKLIPIDLAAHRLPGTFERALNLLLDHERSEE